MYGLSLGAKTETSGRGGEAEGGDEGEKVKWSKEQGIYSLLFCTGFWHIVAGQTTQATFPLRPSIYKQTKLAQRGFKALVIGSRALPSSSHAVPVFPPPFA